MNASHNPNNDLEVSPPPDDCVQTLSWSPLGNFLVAGSWDCQLRCWEIKDNGTVEPKVAKEYGFPLLSSYWNDDGKSVFVGGCDQQVKLWDLVQNAFMQIGMHDSPVKVVQWLSGHNVLMTGGWDKTIKYWDGKQPNPVLTVQLPEKLYSATVASGHVVAALAERQIQIFDLKAPGQALKTMQSPLKYQTRCVAGLTVGEPGYAIGSIEGRVSIQYLNDNHNSTNGFAFKCHRQKETIYAVNNIDFHPLGTFATCGSDGGLSLWDKDSKQRLKQFALCPSPITACKFNKTGNMIAYSTSYDWSAGLSGFTPGVKTHLFVHSVQPNEVQPKGTRTWGFGH